MFNHYSNPQARNTYFEMYKAFPASFFGKTEVEKGNMSKNLSSHLAIVCSSSISQPQNRLPDAF